MGKSRGQPEGPVELSALKRQLRPRPRGKWPRNSVWSPSGDHWHEGIRRPKTHGGSAGSPWRNWLEKYTETRNAEMSSQKERVAKVVLEVNRLVERTVLVQWYSPEKHGRAGWDANTLVVCEPRD